MGAPFYYNETEGGAVYVYLNSPAGLRNDTFSVRLTGKPESRFGFAITGLADINKVSIRPFVPHSLSLLTEHRTALTTSRSGRLMKNPEALFTSIWDPGMDSNPRLFRSSDPLTCHHARLSLEHSVIHFPGHWTSTRMAIRIF